MSTECTKLLVYVLECLTVPVCVHDNAGTAVYQNTAHENLFGKRVGGSCHPVFERSVPSDTRRALEAEGECLLEERLPRGRVATIRVVRLPEGEGYISEVVGIESAGVRSAEVEAFVQTAAHDLKTPLVSIKGYAELLQRELGIGGGRVPTLLERLLVQAHRMEDLLEELLDYARIGMNEPEGQDLDPARAARSAWCSLQDLAEPAAANLEIDEPLPRVRCSPIRLQQIFINLLTNAIRYGREEAAPRLRLLAYEGAREDAPDRVFLALEDNGLGVPEEERERIFELFHRAHQQSCTGTGMGLAIVRRIVEGNGGAIWVEPATQTGSRFVFSLPAADRTAEEAGR